MRIYKRGNVYWYDFQIDGKRHRSSTNRSSKSEAMAVANEVRRKILDAKQLGHLPEVTLGDAVDMWFKHYGSRLKDRERIKIVINVMFNGGGDRGKRKWTWDADQTFHMLTDGDLKRWINIRLEEGVAPATIRAEMNVLRRTVNRLKGEVRTPELSWPSPKEDRRLTTNAKERWLTDEEIAQLRDYLDPHKERPGLPPVDKRSPRLMKQLQDNYDLFEFILYTGARPDEAMSLPWARVDLDRRVLSLRRNKVGRFTQMVIPSRIYDILKRRRQDDPGYTWVFPERDNPVEHRRVCRAIGNAMDALGFNDPWKVEEMGGKAVMYSLRDTFASRLAQSGKHTLQEIALMLGHSSTKMTEKYARLIPSMVTTNVAATLDALDV